ncbi:hypothetical protein RhiirA1_469881 [Rhizophagus irregularis]|uniref:Uncharacterized protein n=2 Tax=Rhizophagus irregularis TaxID=588596 RepID=A0A2N0R759_9GLOM|nr:hypothetical protein RhiirA1_469881 [Rhizophagus irregularis]CAB4472815.1 unnamed protein product [Rhizophagus irregularis]
MGKKDGMTYANEMFDEISRALAIEKGRIFIPYERYQFKRNTREILLRVDIKDTKMPDQPSLSALRKSLDKAVAAYRKFRSHLWSSRISSFMA